MVKGRFEKLTVKAVLWLCILIVCGFVIFLAGAVWDVRKKERLAFQEKERARTILEEAEGRFDALSREVKNFDHERGLEEEFRKRFPVAKEGEEVIVLVDPLVEPVSEPPPQNASWFSTFFGWFQR